MNLSEPFIRRPVATALIMSALALLGLVAFPFLPIAPLPQVDFPTIQVTATLSGASAETMASSVAAPLERQFGQIAGVTQLTSLSSLGVTQVVIQFDLNRNIDLAAQDIQAAITAASKFLPQAMTYPPIYRKVNPADAPIMMLWAHSATLPLTSVHDYLDNIFIQALSQVPGVAQASIIGDQKPSIRVQVDPAKLASIGLTLGRHHPARSRRAGDGSQTGSTDSPNPANTGGFTIVLKPRAQRTATARQIIDRLRPQFAQVPGANVFLTPTQDINVGARIGRGSYQYTLQDPDVDELIEWSQKMLQKLRTLTQLADATSDLLANAPQLKITINRDQAARFGISPQLIDDTLNDAYGQRQITQYYTQPSSIPTSSSWKSCPNCNQTLPLSTGSS